MFIAENRDFKITTLRTIAIVLSLLLCSSASFAGSDLNTMRPVYVSHIITHYSEQLTPPPRENRRCLSQFGYDLQLFTVPVLFPITDFIDPGHFGAHSYNKGEYNEKNGSLYTCQGGFIDFSHLRTGADWTVYLTFKILVDYDDFDLPYEAAALKLNFKNLDELSLEDIASIAEKIAFERLVWHETASWYYHHPNHRISEQRSAFTPEDIYSDLLGAQIGKNIVLRILNGFENLTYSQIATEEIEKVIAELQPMTSKKESKLAYDIVDRDKQLKLPEAQRNKDIWYDSGIIFRDQRYIFKRNMNIGPQVDPWLVPQQEKLGCTVKPVADVLTVPEKTENGISLYKYYDFKIVPDSSLFYSKKTGEELHQPFEAFSTRDFCQVINQISSEMKETLLAGFDQRNNLDPVPQYRKARRVFYR